MTDFEGYTTLFAVGKIYQFWFFSNENHIVFRLEKIHMLNLYNSVKLGISTPTLIATFEGPIIFKSGMHISNFGAIGSVDFKIRYSPMYPNYITLNFRLTLSELHDRIKQL